MLIQDIRRTRCVGHVTCVLCCDWLVFATNRDLLDCPT